jgi:single-strand DNA-binding protein
MTDSASKEETKNVRFRVPKLNKVIIVGNLTNDPVFHVTNTTHATVVNFRVAWSENFRIKNGEARSRTCFINVSAWLKLAEVCKKNLEKGDKVYVEGKLLTHDKVNSEGIRYQDTEILAERIEFLKIKDNENESIIIEEGTEN